MSKFESFDVNPERFRSDGASMRRRRLKDMMLYIMDNPGNTSEQITGYMIVEHGLDAKTVERYLAEMVRYDFIRPEQRSIQGKVDLGLGYFPNGRAKDWLRK